MDHQHYPMIDRRLVASLASLVFGSALVACTPEPGLDFDHIGAHVGIVIEHDARDLCAGSVPHLDRYIERVFEFFEAPLPEELLIPVRVVESPSCPASACYNPPDRTVYIHDLDLSAYRTSGVLRHELSHAVIDRLWGQSKPFFEEGLAESFSRSPFRSRLTPEPVPVGEMFDQPPLGVDYTAAAYFVRFLIDTRGLERFKRLFQGARDRSGDEIRGLMATIYGESFEALQAEFLSGEPRCQYQLDTCDPQTAGRVGDLWYATVPASCDDPSFYGSVGDDDMMVATQYTLEVEVRGTYRLRTSYDWPPLGADLFRSEIVLERCGACDVQFVESFRGPGTDRTIELEAGIYSVEIVMPFETIVTVRLDREGDAMP